MSGPEPPEMEIGERITPGLDFLTQSVGHTLVGIHVEQDGAGVPDQAIGPAGDDASPDDAGERVHPKPAKGAGEQQADDHKHRHGGVGDHMDDGGAHVVVAGGRSMRVLVLFEHDGIVLLADPHRRREGMRFRNLVMRFQEATLVTHREALPRAIRTQRFDRRRLRRQSGAGDGPQPKARRYPVFKHFEHNEPVGGRDLMRFVMVVAFMRVTMAMTMAVAVMLTTAQQPCARDIHRKTKTGNRDRFGKMNRDGIENTADGFIADQQRDHGQHDGAGKPCEIAELAGAECEGRIVGVFAGVSIGKRGQQQRAGVGAHMQSVRHQRDRAKQQAADDFGDHHDPAEPDHRPGLALALLMAFAEEDMAVKSRGCAVVMVKHGVPYFRYVWTTSMS